MTAVGSQLECLTQPQPSESGPRCSWQPLLPKETSEVPARRTECLMTNLSIPLVASMPPRFDAASHRLEQIRNLWKHAPAGSCHAAKQSPHSFQRRGNCCSSICSTSSQFGRPISPTAISYARLRPACSSVSSTISVRLPDRRSRRRFLICSLRYS